MPKWQPNQLRSDPKYARQPDEMMLNRAQHLVRQWAEGMTYEKMAAFHGMTVDGARETLTRHIKSLWQAKYKWKMAEMRCRALALELRYLRVGQECPEDQPIETLEPSEKSLKALKMAGVHTVNQLRSVDGVTLVNRDHFPRSTVVWAILKLDALGLSHRLKLQNKNQSRYPKGREYLRLTGQLKEDSDAADDYDQDALGDARQ